jgi:hypothetical protein
LKLRKSSLVSSEKWSQWPGLNRRPTVYETVALPLSYIGIRSAHNKLAPAGFVKANIPGEQSRRAT